MEYAALLRGWSYGDLTARFKALNGTGGANPLFDKARSFVPDLDETHFVEGVAASLARAEFQLIIAGDGIRSDLHAVASHLNSYGTNAARLSLLEVQLWSDGTERVIVVPTIQLRTEVIEQRVITAADGRPLEIQDPSVGEELSANEEGIPDPRRIEQRQRNRAFWQRFIDEIKFDNPDQPQPRHGGNNWVRFDMPAPATWVTAYRTTNKIGLTLLLKDSDGATLFESWSEESESLQNESGLELRFRVTPPDDGFNAAVSTEISINTCPSEEDQLEWLKSAANRLVNLFRPRLAQWNAAEHTQMKV
jgi:hypothetical protein